MRLQVIDTHHWQLVGDAQTFGHIGTNEQGAHETRSLGDGNGGKVSRGDVGFFEGRFNYGDDVALVSPGSQFGDNPSVLFMHGLTGRDVGKDFAIAQYGRRCIVATAFNAQNNGGLGIWWIQWGRQNLNLRD